MFSNAAQNDKKAVKYKTLTRVYLYVCLEWNKQTALFTFTVDRDDKHQPVSMVTDVICL